MTVKELIEKLQKQPSDWEVVMQRSDDGKTESIDAVMKEREICEDNSRNVIIIL